MDENQISNQSEVNNSVNQSNMNQLNSSVPPIAEVKIEASDSITTEQSKNQNNEISVSSVSTDTGSSSQTEPPNGSNKSTILLILLFVFFFAFIMGMPYIHEFVENLKSDTGLSEIEQQAKEEEEKQKQEEESNQPVPTPEEEKTKELVCTSGNSVVGNYTLVETQVFYYNSSNQILSSKLVSQYNFTIMDDSYNSLKQQCDDNSLKYLTHEGYTMACSYGEANIEISHEFDLETFTPIVDGDTNIQANATYQQNLNTVKNNLISQGYTCQ